MVSFEEGDPKKRRHRARDKKIRQLFNRTLKTLEAFMDDPIPCDGSCLITQELSESIPCTEGEPLRLYWCSHELTYIMTTYVPAFRLTSEIEDCPY
jgi:hypothetical protein